MDNELEMSHLIKFADSLNYMRKNSMLTDVVLLSNDGACCEAHKSVLTASGSYFADIFRSDPFQESIDTGINGDVLEILIEFLYTGILHIPTKIKIENVLASASFLGLEKIIQHCTRQMFGSIGDDNILEFLNIAETFNINDMKEAIFSYEPKNFKKLVEKNLLCKFPKERFESILKIPGLKCTEDEKLDAILKWVHFDEADRKNCASSLITIIDVSRLSFECLDKIADDTLIENDPQLMQTLMKEMTKRMESLVSEANSSLTSSVPTENNTSPRNGAVCKDISASTSTAVRNASSYKADDKIRRNPPPRKQFTQPNSSKYHSFSDKQDASNTSPLQQLTKPETPQLSGEKILAFRIEQEKYTQFSHCITSASQTSVDGSIELPSQNEKCIFPFDASICKYTDAIFCFGGRTELSWRKLETTLVYYIRGDKWERRADMSDARSDTGCAVLDAKIYVVGGIDQRNIRQRLVECYDPVANTWRQLSPMNMCRQNPGVCATNDCLYVIGGYALFPEQYTMQYINSDPNASGEIYNPDTDQWTMLSTKLPVGRMTNEKEYRIVFVSGRIFSVRSHRSNSNRELHFFYEYFPVAKIWKKIDWVIDLQTIICIEACGNYICLVDENGNFVLYSPHECKLTYSGKLTSSSKCIQYATCIKP